MPSNPQTSTNRKVQPAVIIFFVLLLLLCYKIFSSSSSPEHPLPPRPILHYSGDAKVSAEACKTWRAPDHWPFYENWSGEPFPEVADDILKTVKHAKDSQTHKLDLQKPLFVRVTQFKSSKYPHIDEALLQRLQLNGWKTADAECVTASDSTGAAVSFLWGNNEKKVDIVDCPYKPVEDAELDCFHVDTKYFKQTKS
ncbi:hypothetical protein CJU89_2939 [Yarrowia sp. B02]|nr:hypothetical protein CJU89_2939 [Yarrowia sp. B02]